MDASAALRLAIDLMHIPSRVRIVREEPLPPGMGLLLQVAARVDEAEREGVEMTGRPIETLREAATFFVEQVLFAPQTDCYRALGSTREATTGELRHNMALLLRWLHPDVAIDRDRSVFAARVALAWDTLKTPDRRAAYDLELEAAPKAARRRKRRLPHGPLNPFRVRTGMKTPQARPVANPLATVVGVNAATDIHRNGDPHSVFAVPHAGRGWDAPEVRALPTAAGGTIDANGHVHVVVGHDAAAAGSRSAREFGAERAQSDAGSTGFLYRLVRRWRTPRS